MTDHDIQLKACALRRAMLRFGLLLGYLLAPSAFAASGMFPKMPAAPKAYVVEIAKDSENAKMTAWALQGMLNQQSAEVYLINNWWDVEPLEFCGKPFDKISPLAGTDGGLRALFQKYQVRVKKMFLYDPDKDWTWYLALMSAAQQNGIPVTEMVRSKLVSEFGWQGEVEDFRNRWANRIEAYEWALTNLMPHCSKQVVFATGNRRTGANEERIANPITDYAVASKGFAFWLDFKKERWMVEKIFLAGGYGVGTSLMGYANTGDDGNVVANPYGIGYVVNELFPNGSFWSSFPNKTYTQRPGKAVLVEPGKIYASITWSDGDNFDYAQNALWKYWHDPGRGKIPVATTLAPALQELNTPLLDWYYSKMTDNDELVAGPTGVQFIYIRDFNRELLPAWVKLNRAWGADAGFRSVYMFLMPLLTPKYMTYVAGSGLEGAIGEFFSVNSNFVSVACSGISDEGRLFPEFTAVKPKVHAPVFHSFVCIAGGFYREGDRGYSAIKRQIDRLEKEFPGRYVFLLPKDQFATIRAYYSQKPASHEISARPGTEQGLYAVQPGDGGFTITERDGVRCWVSPKRNSPHYFYLETDRNFLSLVGGVVEIEFEYLNVGSGEIRLQYDSTDSRLPDTGAFKQYLYPIRRTNNQQWQTARFRLTDARFAGRQNDGADFRFYNGGDDLFIRTVRVKRIEK